MLTTDLIDRKITGDTENYMFSVDLGENFSDAIPVIPEVETTIIFKNKNTSERGFLYFNQKNIMINSKDFLSFEKNSMADFLADIINTEKKINIEKNDDFYSYLLKSVCDLNSEIIDKYINPEKNEEYYLNKCEELFINVPEELYAEDISSAERIEFLKTLVENQYSLDNLTKTGIRSYYESLGYKNVRVKYDKNDGILKIFGDSETASKEVAAIMTNGEINLENLVSAGEKISDINEIYSFMPNGSKNIIYSKNDIINNITNNIEEIENIKKEMITIENGKIIVKSAVLSLNVLGMPLNGTENPNEVYMKLYKSDFYKNIKNLEYISFLILSLMKRLNTEIEDINSKQTEFSQYFNYVNSSLNLKNDDINNLKTGITSLIEKCKLINEKISSVNENIDIINEKKVIIQNAVESSLGDEEIKEYVNNLESLTSSLEEFEKRITKYSGE